MNILGFEIKEQVLTRIDSKTVINKNKKVYKCRFSFEEGSDWVEANKFAIFQDGWRNKATVHLGTGNDTVECYVPERVMRGGYFQVSVYAGDLLTTNSVSVALIQSGYPRKFPHKKHGDIFIEIFKRLDGNVDSITYDNHNLYLYNKDKCLEVVYLPFVLEEEFGELVGSLVEDYMGTVTLSSEDREKLDSIESGANKTIVDMELDIESFNPICNKAVTEALNGKENSFNLIERLDDIVVNLINNGE